MEAKMSNPRKALALLIGFTAFSLVLGCQSQREESTVTILDESHFEYLATGEDDLGNASASIEIVSDLPAEEMVQEVVEEKAPEPQLPLALETDSKIIEFNRKVQIALKSAGFYKGKIDGEIGPGTRRAIKSFQTANHLAPDGLVGPNTWERLKKHYYGKDSV